MGCVVNMIHFAVFGLILLINLIASLIANIGMMKYIRKNVSLVGSVGVSLRNGVAKTVFAMTMSSTCGQVVLVALLFVFVSSFAVKFTVVKHGAILLVSFIISVLLNAGTVPLVYILRNTRMRNILRC